MEDHETLNLQTVRERAIYLAGCRAAFEWCIARPYSAEKGLEMVHLEEALNG